MTKKLEEYEGKMHELLYNFPARFTNRPKLKSCFSFVVNSFELDVFTKVCPIPQPLLNRGMKYRGNGTIEHHRRNVTTGAVGKSCFKNSQ